MICDARPVLRLSEDGTDLVERQVAEDPKFENFPVRLFHGMQSSVDPEGRIPVRYFLLDVGIIGGKDFRYRLGFFRRRCSSRKQFFAMAQSQVTSSDSFRKEEAVWEKARKKDSWVISSAVCRSPASVMI